MNKDRRTVRGRGRERGERENEGEVNRERRRGKKERRRGRKKSGKEGHSIFGCGFQIGAQVARIPYRANRQATALHMNRSLPRITFLQLEPCHSSVTLPLTAAVPCFTAHILHIFPLFLFFKKKLLLNTLTPRIAVVAAQY